MRTRGEMRAKAKTHYFIQCFTKEGVLRWSEEFDNLIVTAGLNKLLDATFKTGLAAPAWYIGLVGATNTYNAADILSSHVGWAENTHYAGDRQALILGAISAGSVNNADSRGVFTMEGTAEPDTINGAFLCDAETGTVGTLYGEGNFNAARSVYDDDIIMVQVTLTMTSS